MSQKLKHGEHGEGTEYTEKSSCELVRASMASHELPKKGFLRGLRAFSVLSVFQGVVR